MSASLGKQSRRAVLDLSRSLAEQYLARCPLAFVANLVFARTLVFVLDSLAVNCLYCRIPSIPCLSGFEIGIGLVFGLLLILDLWLLSLSFLYDVVALAALAVVSIIFETFFARCQLAAICKRAGTQGL